MRLLGPLLCVLVACTPTGAGPSSPTSGSPTADTCPRLGPVQPHQVSKACDGGDRGVCEAECSAGRSAACFVRGLLAQHDQDDTQASWFARGCAAGSPIACTNFGAEGFAAKRKLEPGCMLSLFQAACAESEPFGCGMMGRMYVEDRGIAPNAAKAREILVPSCKSLGGFPCWVLGTYLHDGRLGDVDDGGARDAFARGCKTGYAPACTSLDELDADKGKF